LDNLTHSLFGLTLARTQLGRAGRGTTTALLLASNAPDIDILATAGGAAKYLEWHRGPTHGPLGIIGLACVTAAIVWVARRKWDTNTTDAPASFAMLWAVSTVGILFHVLMDLPTSYGMRPFSPFDWHWFATDWMPIVDIYLLVALAAGLLFGHASPAARRRNAAIVLIFMTANYGLRAAAHHQALLQAPRLFGPLLPLPCEGAMPDRGLIDRWPRTMASTPRDQSATRCLVELAATPSFTSPFRWRVIAHLSNAYELHDIDLLDRRFRQPAPSAEVLWRLSLRFPNQWTPVVTKASASGIAQVFLGFSRFPAARSYVDREGAATVRWSDMRFVMDALGDQRPRPANLFTATVRLDPAGHIVEERLGP
jgi:inner membrane protein